MNILCGTHDDWKDGKRKLESGLGNNGESTEILNIFQSRLLKSRILLYHLGRVPTDSDQMYHSLTINYDENWSKLGSYVWHIYIFWIVPVFPHGREWSWMRKIAYRNAIYGDRLPCFIYPVSFLVVNNLMTWFSVHCYISITHKATFVALKSYKIHLLVFHSD